MEKYMEYKMSTLFKSLSMTSDDEYDYYDDFDYIDDLLVDYLFDEEEKNAKCNGSGKTKACAGKPSTKSVSSGDSTKSCETGPDKPVKYEGDGLNCGKCGNFYPFSEPNQKDGSLICYSCRNFG